MQYDHWKYRGVLPTSYGSITALEFDCEQELLWMGDTFGYISSYAPQQPFSEALAWTTYSSFRGCKDTCIALSTIATASGGLVCSGYTSALRIHKRGGISVTRHDISTSVLKRVFAVQADPTNQCVFVAGEAPSPTITLPSFGGYL